ncbi:MAG: extracellular solute-binding protein [Angelakisella sp.]
MKRTLSLLVAVAMLAATVLSGCGAKPSSASSTAPSASTSASASASDATSGSASVTELPKIENFNPTGYPIVNTPITITGIISAGAFYGDFNEMTYFKELEKLTGITIKWDIVTQKPADVYNLMFASQDYRDIACNSINDTLLQGAIDAGDVYPLDEMINNYAPNWKKFFDGNEYAKKVSVMSDGKLWGFPIVREEPSNVGIRDQWMICTQWLDELKLPMPKTTDDFYNVLKAFKANAGKGTIPTDVIPWYLNFDAYSNGGQFELLNAFGVFTPGNNRYLSVDESGKVVDQAVNPAIKEPIKFMNKLYSEGLIPPDAFTGAKSYEATVTSKTPMTGSFTKYFNEDATGKIYQPMPPLTSPQNSTPMYRRQTNGYSRNKTIIFKQNKHPEATVRYFDTIADPDWSVQAMYGMLGEWIDKDGEKYVQRPFEGNEVYANVPGNNLAFLIDPIVSEKLVYSGAQATRNETIKNIYAPAVVPQERYVPSVVWTTEELDARKELEPDYNAYVKKSIAKWITEGGIDAEWDAYLAECERLGGSKIVGIFQGAVDRFNK